MIEKVNKKYVFVVGLTLCILSGVVFMFAKGTDVSTISVYENALVCDVGQQVNISIMCHPFEPIKGVELKIRFNPLFYRADSVTVGSMFDGVETFFSGGQINNSDGTIVNIFVVVLGPGIMVSQDGSIVNVALTCLQLESSPLELYDVGLCNETGYINVTVTNGVIKTAKPWDVNKDCSINFLDFIRLAVSYGQHGTPGWIHEDVNHDGVINIRDFVAVSNHFGETY